MRPRHTNPNDPGPNRTKPDQAEAAAPLNPSQSGGPALSGQLQLDPDRLKFEQRRDLKLMWCAKFKDVQGGAQAWSKYRELRKETLSQDSARRQLARIWSEVDDLEGRNGILGGKLKEELAEVWGPGGRQEIDRVLDGGPQIFSAPGRNTEFVESNAFIAKIRNQFERRNRDGSGKKIVLLGLPGIGKTQSALEYVHRFKEDYALICWIRCEEFAVNCGHIAADLKDYAGLASSTLNASVAIGESLKKLVTLMDDHRREGEENLPNWRSNKWLLVFDSANSPQDLPENLGDLTGGDILITSWNQNIWPVGEFSRLPVQCWSESDSITFLCNHTGQDDEESATALAKELGCFPFALKQAVATIRVQNYRLKDYLGQLRSQPDTLLDLLDRVESAELLTRVTSLEHKAALKTWNIARNEIDKKAKEGSEPHAGAIELLNLSAYLASDPISKTMVALGAEHLTDALSIESKITKAVGILLEYSLVEPAGRFFSVHKLVQVITRQQFSDALQNQWADRTFKVLLTAFAQLEGYDKYDDLLPHILLLGNLIHRHKWKFHEPTDILARLVPYLYARVRPKQIKRLLNDIFPGGEIYCVPFTRISRPAEEEHRLMKRLKELEKNQEKVQEANEIRLILAFQMFFRGEMRESEKLFIKCSEVPHSFVPNVVSLPMLATFALYKGNYEDKDGNGAINKAERCITLVENLPRELQNLFIQPHGQALWAIAEARMRQKKYLEAKTYIEKSIEICGSYPDTNVFCNATKGVLRQKMKSLSEPDYCAQALELLTNCGPFEKGTAYSFSGEAALLAGDLKSALKFYQTAVKIFAEGRQSDSDPVPADFVPYSYYLCHRKFQIARILVEQDKSDKAKDLMQKEVLAEVKMNNGQYDEYFAFWKRAALQEAAPAFCDFLKNTPTTKIK